MKQRLIAFPPLVAAKPQPHTLILGTMPSEKSLEMQQYYAHPQNQFWKFMGALYGADPALPYHERVQRVTEKGVAIWDVLKACTREGSMDSAIKDEEVNDFGAFFTAYPSIARVVFDSLTAETIYKRYVQPRLNNRHYYARVPSPSPAHARLSFSEKLVQWEKVLRPQGEASTAGER